MKIKNIAALCAATIIAIFWQSCTEYLDDVTEDDERTLVLVSQINANDTINYVYVAVSNALNITMPRGLSLKVLVNDVQLDSVHLLSFEDKPDFPYLTRMYSTNGYAWNGDTTQFCQFRLRHRFAEGDRIRIEAQSSCCTQMAWGETVVPQATAHIAKVDTTTIHRQESNFPELQLNIDIEDNLATQDYFRLEICDDFDFYYPTPVGGRRDTSQALIHGPYGNELSDDYFTGIQKVTVRNLDFDYSDDIILTEGNAFNSVTTQTSPSSSTTIEFFPSYENSQTVFTDAVFAAGRASLKVYVDYSTKNNSYLAHEFLTPYAKYTVEHCTRVRVHTISPEYYRYLKVFSVLTDDSYEDWNMMMEPMTTYENVHGGIGFVTASNAAEYIIRFPKESHRYFNETKEYGYENDDYIYDDEEYFEGWGEED